MNKKAVWIVLATVIAMVVVLGCGNIIFNKRQLAPQNELRLNLHNEPATIDPGVAEDLISGSIARAAFDGLTRIGADGKPHPSMAEKIDISPDRLTYTFTLRDSRWSNGDPVTAYDFEYAWKRVLNPLFGANYAYQLYHLKNAEKANKGKISMDEVGVKALDDKRLLVTLEHPAPYFLELTAFYTYYPVNHKVVEANPEWALDAETFVSNGPFKVESWKHGEKLVLTKNPYYWDRDAVKLDGIQFSMEGDERKELSMFEKNELDWAGAPLSALPLDALPELGRSGKLISKPIAGTYWYSFNTERFPFDNKKIRQAFVYAINRQEITAEVAPGNRPATGVVPSSMALHPQGYFRDNDAETARKLLAEGMKEAGIEQLPPVTLMYNMSETHAKIAKAVQKQWKQVLGVDVRLEEKDWGTFIRDLHQGNYQIGRVGWVGDFNDPVNFLELFKEKSTGTNYSKWENAAYKSLLNQSVLERVPDKRRHLLAQAEQILMEEMPVAPVYFYTDTYVMSERVSGVIIDGLGFVDYKWAKI
ncbi:peptide ABC transporter substrate-binding protein, partial [Brevibacillus massiliensis]|uniref:peptide ABC transporter substrate-binding protein n=1 Tax=Brevibacillus massiliensis TaxID=1118054 RepID=UPI000377A3AD